MSMKWLRYSVATAIALLVANEFVRWLSGLAGVTAAVVGGVAVVAVSVAGARAAQIGVRNVVRFLLPVAVLILIPTGVRVWRFFGDDASLGERLWRHLPFLLGFVAPVAILLVVWTQLHEPELDDLPPPE